MQCTLCLSIVLRMLVDNMAIVPRGSLDGLSIVDHESMMMILLQTTTAIHVQKIPHHDIQLCPFQAFGAEIQCTDLDGRQTHCVPSALLLCDLLMLRTNIALHQRCFLHIQLLYQANT